MRDQLVHANAKALRHDDAWWFGAWPHVILVERGDGPIPVLQTTWSLRFDTDEQRDDFFEWLCVRLDRWPAWAEMADGHPHLELTQHLLMVMTAALAEGVERIGN